MDWYAPADEVVVVEPDRVVTRREVRAGEPCFRDHFPGRPVLPGVLAVEALVRACRCLLRGRESDAGRWVLASASAVRFSRFVEPGQTLECEARLLDHQPGRASFAATARVSGPGLPEGGAPAVNGRLTLRPVRLAGPGGLTKAPTDTPPLAGP